MLIRIGAVPVPTEGIFPCWYYGISQVCGFDPTCLDGVRTLAYEVSLLETVGIGSKRDVSGKIYL